MRPLRKFPFGTLFCCNNSMKKNNCQEGKSFFFIFLALFPILIVKKVFRERGKRKNPFEERSFSTTLYWEQRKIKKAQNRSFEIYGQKNGV